MGVKKEVLTTCHAKNIRVQFGVPHYQAAVLAQVHMTVLPGPKLKMHLFKSGCFMCLLYTTGLYIFDYFQLSTDIIYI